MIFTAKNYLHNKTKTKKLHRTKRREKLTRYIRTEQKNMEIKNNYRQEITLSNKYWQQKNNKL
jgi:hypothetical protein